VLGKSAAISEDAIVVPFPSTEELIMGLKSFTIDGIIRQILILSTTNKNTYRSSLPY